MEKEMSIKTDQSRARIVPFRVFKTILVIGMLSGGITMVIRLDFQVDLFNHLGFPLFLMTIIGVGKILAALVLMVPRIPLLKIGAYVGTFIVSVCAFISHMVANDGVAETMPPLILMAVVLAAWFLNPYIKIESTDSA